MNIPAQRNRRHKSLFIYKWIGWLIPPLFVNSKTKIEKDFSVRVCKEWEACFEEIQTPQTKKICLRTAVTLG